MKNTKRFTAALLTAGMVVTMCPVSVLAEEANTSKEEVVYINLNGDGSVSEINVVNIFDLSTAGQIVDYGEYESTRNMTTKDEIVYSADKVTIDAEKGKLYYEGKLSDNAMPWNISIQYFMNGKEYSAKEIAGMSGELKIKMHITESGKSAEEFFDGYALQASFKLDTEKCTNITAEGATIANVGNDKQLTYTILPGKGADVEITADVTEFEMESVAINGIRLNLNIEVDTTLIQGKIDELLGAVNKLDAGAGELNGGASELYGATSVLAGSVNQMYSGVGSLTSGAGELSSGLAAIASNNSELLNGAWTAFQGICTASQTALNSQLEEKGMAAVTLTPNNYAEVLTGVLAQIDPDNVYKIAYDTALAEVTSQVEARADEVYAGYIDSIANEVYLTYLKTQETTIYQQVAGQVIVEQLVSEGYSQESAEEFLNGVMGQMMLTQAVNSLTEEQKSQIMTAAVERLTDEQKQAIKDGALSTLTEEQKTQIREGYIEEKMKSQEVTDPITEAVAAANAAAASIADLKGQLDNYSRFYNGLVEYTSAVSNAANGASTLKYNMDKLYSSTGTLNSAVSQLNEGVKKLFSGTTELEAGTNEFVEQTSGMDSMVSEEVDSMVASISGSDVETISFVSEKNTNIKAVQFVVQTEAIKAEEVVEETEEVEEESGFFDKLLNLFGL